MESSAVFYLSINSVSPKIKKNKTIVMALCFSLGFTCRISANFSNFDQDAIERNITRHLHQPAWILIYFCIYFVCYLLGQTVKYAFGVKSLLKYLENMQRYMNIDCKGEKYEIANLSSVCDICQINYLFLRMQETWAKVSTNDFIFIYDVFSNCKRVIFLWLCYCRI